MDAACVAESAGDWPLCPLPGEMAAQRPEEAAGGGRDADRDRVGLRGSRPDWRRESTCPSKGRESATFSIATEMPADIAAREALLDRAMGPKRKRKASEKLRRGRLPAKGLAFVARDGNGTLVGTVRLWEVRLGKTGAVALLLGPLAVEPVLKGAGIGAALMRHAIVEAARRGHRAVLLVGDAPYYARFGFSAEKTDRLSMPGPYEKERFLALELTEGALDQAHGVLEPAGRKVRPALQARAA